jgi:hypothetical protein
MALKVMSWNSHSISGKKPELSRFIYDHDIDIILLCETWLKDNSSFALSGYNSFLVNREYGGVGIFIKTKFNVVHHHRIALSYAEAISVTINDNNNALNLVSLYCSPAATRAQAKDFFTKVFAIPGRSVFAGDFNAKHIAWNNPKNCRKGIDIVKLCTDGRLQIHKPDLPTLHSSRGAISTVDFAISRSVSGISQLTVLNELSSDHLPVVFTCPLSGPTPSEEKFFNWKRANWKKFGQNLSQLQLVIPLNSPKDIDMAVETVSAEIRKATKAAVPVQKAYKFRYPFSQTLHLLTRERNRYRKQYRITLRPEFKSLVNQLNRLIKMETSKLNSESFAQKLSTLRTNDNSAYSFARALKGKKQPVPPLAKADGSVAYSDEAKANALAESFLSNHQVSLNSNSKFDQMVSRKVAALRAKCDSSEVVDNVSACVLKQMISNLKIRKAAGLDLIHTRSLKNLPRNVIELIAKIFNACLKMSYFPTAWKAAKIVAIPKQGKPAEQTSSYRPISLLSTIGKLFERVILDRILSFNNQNNVLIQEQFGFRRSHSTVQQIVRIVEGATVGFNKGHSTGLVLLDLEKAFDSVWHDGLIFKLIKIGYPSHLVKLLDSFLRNRRATISIGKAFSSEFVLPAGVPQGSAISPALFNIFTNDIPKTGKCHLAEFADDTALFYSSIRKSVDFFREKLCSDLDRILQFFRNWKIKVNDSKTEFTILSRSHRIINESRRNSFTYNGHTFSWKTQVKYLGFLLDQKLTFKPHIDHVLAKTQRVGLSLYCLFKKHNSVPVQTKIQMYRSIIRPIFTYASPVFVNCAKSHTKRLQVTQNKFLRMCLNASYYSHTTDLHKNAKIPYVHDFMIKLTDNFYSRSESSENSLISSLGNYAEKLGNRRIKHKLPRPT